MSVSHRRSSVVVPVDHGDDGVLRIPDDAIRRLSVIKPDIGQEQEDAELATAFEMNLTVRQALRLYKRAVFCSCALSLAVVMEGYDLSAIGALLGFDAFRAQFGTELDPEGMPRISAAWQAGVQNGTQVGSIIGLYINGYLSEWIGYKKTMYISVIACACFNFIHFFSASGGMGMVCAGSILMGIPFGIFQTLTVTYASDITPVVLRPYLTTYVNLCWVMGQFVSAGVLRGTQPLGNQWAWRIPIAVQWSWLPLIFIAAWFAPESPWWCVRKGRYEQARASLLKCTSKVAGLEFNPDHKIAMIKHTNDLEEALHAGVGYLDCFRGAELRRTVIACMVWLAQAFCGAALMGYSVQIYREAGLSEEGALNLNIGQYGLGFCGTVLSWFLMKRIGRRPLYVYGHVVLFCLLLVIGGLGVISRDSTGAAWALGSMLLVYTVVYDLTVGPVCYAFVAEIASTRLKIKTVVLARNLYNIGGLINNALVPRMLSPTDWNWAGMTGFFYAGLCALLIIYFFFCLPETKDRTFAELDILFENRVPSRKFKATNVNQFSGATTEIQVEDSDAGTETEKRHIHSKEAV